MRIIDLVYISTIVGLVLMIVTIVVVVKLIYDNTGERGAAKRAERDYRWRKYYETKDEIDQLERELNQKTAEFYRDMENEKK